MLIIGAIKNCNACLEETNAYTISVSLSDHWYLTHFESILTFLDNFLWSLYSKGQLHILPLYLLDHLDSSSKYGHLSQKYTQLGFAKGRLVMHAIF